MTPREWVCLQLWKLYLTLLGLSVSLISLIILPFFIPTLIWRSIAKGLRPFLRPDLDDIVACTSSVFAQVDGPGDAKSAAILQITLQGHINYDEFLTLLHDKWISCQDSRGKPRYPEFRQFITSWLGYKFWKWEENFSLCDHVHVISDHNIVKSSADIAKIGACLISRSFPEKKSPWDVTLVPGRVNGEMSTVLYLRTHHSIADGSTVALLFQRMCGEDNPTRLIVRTTSPRTFTDRVKSWGKFPFQVFHILGEIAHASGTPALWKIPEGKKSPNWCLAMGKEIPVSTIIRIKNHFKMPFSSVVYALVAGGIHRFIEKEKTSMILNQLRTVVAVPVEGTHPDRMCNKFSFVLVSYPIGIRDSVERLYATHRNFVSQQNSPAALMGYLGFILLGSHFNFVGKLVNVYPMSPLATSYFPFGYNPDWKVQACQVSKVSFYMRLQQGHQGGIITICSMKNVLNVNLLFNANVMSQLEVEKLAGCVEEEAKALLYAAGGVEDKKIV